MIATNWGYSLTGVTEMPDILSVAEFNAITGGKFTGDTRIDSAIMAATATARNYVGWHLATNLDCEIETVMLEKCITRVGSDLLIQLPSKFVTEVNRIIFDAIKTDGVWSGDDGYNYSFEARGILRAYDVPVYTRFAKVVIQYKAGVDGDMLSGIKDLIASNASHVLAVPVGVASESAGGVSISYSASVGSDGSAAKLTSLAADILAPYKISGVY